MDVPSSEGGEGVAELGTMSQVCAFFFEAFPKEHRKHLTTFSAEESSYE